MLTRILIKVVAALALALVLASGLAEATQQTPPAAQPDTPTLTAEQQLQLLSYAQSDEIIQLRLQVLQLQYATLQAETRQYLATLQKPGYRLERTPAQAGQPARWVYTREPETPEGRNQ